MPETAGPVEREARQLVEAAARWLSVVPDNGEYAARTGDLGAAEQEQERGEEQQSGDHEQSEEHLCRGCPWCRARAAAGPIGADTLDSLAHLLGAAAESLSLFAQSRRESAGGEPAGAESSGEPTDEPVGDESDDGATAQDSEHAARGGVVDAVIDWEDEDEDELLADEGDEGTRSPSRERKVR